MADLVVADPEPIAHAKRRASLGESHPTTSSKPDTVGPNDPDTCRICRGEATPGEPLFYPCKCSGSIKYVHQDCLMEWLSHSQKKHCELCKTPFRFTKLYAPDMPTSLPTVVIVKHIAKYLFRNLVVWLRAALVGFVWLGCLPYLMRAAWSFLFWISDEGLGGPSLVFIRRNTTASVFTLTGQGASEPTANPLIVPSDTCSASAGMYDTSGSATNASSDFGISAFFQLLWAAVTFNNQSVADVTIVPQSPPSPPSPLAQQTLLGGYPVLTNLTRYPAVNRMVVSVLEGQVVTILVIVCFILIILVRDYVVQQQPEINMRAAFAAAENQPAQPVAPQPQPQPQPADVAVPDPDWDDPAEHDPDDAPIRQQVEVHRRELEAQRRQFAENVQPEARDRVARRQHRPRAQELPRVADGIEHREPELGPVVPSNPDPETAQSTAIERQDSHDSESPPAHQYLHDYSRIFREAGGDPDKILRIVKEEGLEAKLDYWIQRTQAKREKNRQNDDSESPSDSFFSESSRSVQASSSLDNPADPVFSETLRDETTSSSKGKERAEEEPDILLGTPLRPRANTDGPQVNQGVHPFANNNWQLPNVPSEEAGPAHVAESATLGTETHNFSQRPRPLSEESTDRQSSIFPTPPSSFLPETPSEPEHGDLASRPEEDEDHAPPGDAVPAHGTQEGLLPEAQGLEDWDGELVPTVAVPQNQENQEGHQRARPVGLLGHLADFMWRNVDGIPPEELHVPIPPAAFLDGDDDFPEDDAAEILAEEPERDPEVMDAAMAAGLDPEAIEDAEDLEGVMELLGMRGPLAGLFQNAIFCACLVSITIFLGVFLPYNIGRISVWAVAKPMRLVQIFFSLIKLIQDVAVVGVGMITWALFRAWGLSMQLLGRASGWMPSQDYVTSMTKTTWDSATNASWRIFTTFTTDFAGLGFSPVEIKTFSAISHEALLIVKDQIYAVLTCIRDVFGFVFGGNVVAKAVLIVSFARDAISLVWHGLLAAPAYVVDPALWVISLDSPDSTLPVNPSLAWWSATDRFWAISFGYLALFTIAALYLNRGSPFASSQVGQEWEASIIDGLNQASGVMKVILIIGIEMLVFPLYCGLLLDIALLPLFDRTTVESRVLFTVNNPFTSVFVHWFVGTGYMFHFALFVSMCRKIMRKGVLYFIRDPDDPEFHPVRDVLERPLTSQLRKILFSAFVYGALVMICLGGVVWGLAIAVSNVLPIHYSSNEPVLEFPIDLLFYNFLMPLAVKFFRPSDGLHAMYTWWFRKCARMLRVTWFLFGERRVDEEGILQLAADSPHQSLPWWRTALLEFDSEAKVVPKTWHDTFEGGTAKPTSIISDDDMFVLSVKKQLLVESGQLIKDGRFVRTPASDQVKIPKGWKVFLDASETNVRADGKVDNEGDLYSGEQYQLVYVPPNFRLRVSLFIILIWIFAAVTGVGITIVPLVFGRRMFKLLIPAHVRTNDIYAFSIGIYILGSLVYAILHARAIYSKTRAFLSSTLENMARRDVAQKAASYFVHGLKLFYTYFTLLVIFPLLASALVEVYFLVPLHTYMYPLATVATPIGPVQQPRHTVRLIQSWTLGLLYLQLAAGAVTIWYPETRFGVSIRAVLRRGFLDPDVPILTRAFVVPGVIVALSALLCPILAAQLAISRGWLDSIIGATPNPAVLTLVYRASYPAATFLACVSWGTWSALSTYTSWKVRIKDEAYLIGERLHNLSAGAGNGMRARKAYRAGGDRL